MKKVHPWRRFYQPKTNEDKIFEKSIRDVNNFQSEKTCKMGKLRADNNRYCN